MIWVLPNDTDGDTQVRPQKRVALLPQYASQIRKSCLTRALKTRDTVYMPHLSAIFVLEAYV